MKGMGIVGFVFLLGASLMSCSQVSTNSGACGKSGYYGDQEECQNSVSLGTCTSVTVQSADKNLVCWQSSTSQNQTGNTNTGTGTGTGCNGQSPPWTMGAWTPSSCGAGITQRTRTVTCNYPCPCAGAQPSTTESCAPNMYNNVHYESECTAASGTLEWIEGKRVCKFSGAPTVVNIPGGGSVTVPGPASCPSGWTQLYYGNIPYTITSQGSAQEHTNCVGGRRTVYTGSHSSFTPAKAKESLVYCSSRNCFGCNGYSTVYANVTQVACY